MLRIGVAGAGPWARETHLPAIATHPDVELAGMWTRRKQSAADLDVYRFESFDELVDASDIVAFAVPPAAQAPLAVRAAEAGKHVILDKPIADSLSAAGDVVEAIAVAHVRSVVCFTRRFAPETRAFVAAVDGGDFRVGSGVWFSGALLGGRYAQSGWRHESGALLDVGPHVIDLVDRTLGKIDAIGHVAHDPSADLWNISASHTGGHTSTIQLSLRVPAHRTLMRFELAGPSGIIELSSRATDSPTCFSNLLTEFSENIRTGTEHECNAARGLRIQRAIAAISEFRVSGE